MTTTKTKRLFNFSLDSVLSREAEGPLLRFGRPRSGQEPEITLPARPLLGPDRLYVVEPGDSLSRIAERTLGDAARWIDVFEANKRELEAEGLIRVGQSLTIPED